jgi:hypothetical protein
MSVPVTPPNLLDEPIVVINIGIEGFAQSLSEQNVEVVHIAWSPPAGGDQEMIDILDGLL